MLISNCNNFNVSAMNYPPIHTSRLDRGKWVATFYGNKTHKGHGESQIRAIQNLIQKSDCHVS